jgi:hypothetical protein
MEKAIAIILFALVVNHLSAQDGKPATQADINFHNKVKEVFQKAMPTNFREWDFSIPQSNTALYEIGNYVSFCEGTSCFRSEQMEATYDGSQIKFNENIALQKEIQSMNASAPDYVKKLSIALGKLENITKLQISFCVNCGEMGTLEYCKPAGYQKLPPPTGWNSYYTSPSPLSCITDTGRLEDAIDISIFSMGVLPTLTENKESIPIEGTLRYTLNKALMKTYKIQNVVLKIQGAKQNALELVKGIDVELFQLLIQK